MNPLDGNAIAGQLFELFGRHMTAERARYGHCGAITPVTELELYASGPGAVARCRTCRQVTLVITDIGRISACTSTCGSSAGLLSAARCTPA